jgi:clathrin heavy chain
LHARAVVNRPPLIRRSAQITVHLTTLANTPCSQPSSSSHQHTTPQLTALGITADSIKFKNVTLQSEKYVCVREEGAKSVAVIDTATKNVMRLPVAVDSAIMNPASKVLALRSGENLQIYNLEMKSKMKSIVFKEPVVFWRWLSGKTIAIVS